MSDQSSETLNRTHLTIAVYQNGDHISGILQQAYNLGLLSADTRESGHEGTATETHDSHTETNLEAKGKAPALASMAGQVGYRRDRGAEMGTRQDQRVVSSYEYTEAYYLHHVRKYLTENGLLNSVTGIEHAYHLKPGDFVEFQACFQPSQITPFLDIFTGSSHLTVGGSTRR